MSEARKKGIKVFSVDTWLGSGEHSGIAEVIEKRLFGIFLENMRDIINDINVIRAESEFASRIFNDNSLDAVFIDADHRYESVKKDIQCWLPKVKVGGVISGHDYAESHHGVIRAVNEIIPQAEIINCEQGNKCWYYKK